MSQLTAVEPMHQVGFQDVILPLVKSALSKFVFTGIGWSVVVGVMIAAAGRRSSVSATVVDSSSTNSRDHQFAVCVTVESKVGNYDIMQSYGEKRHCKNRVRSFFLVGSKKIVISQNRSN